MDDGKKSHCEDALQSFDSNDLTTRVIEAIIRNRLAVEERPFKSLVMRYKAWTNSINSDTRENMYGRFF
jgi:hypothetical protein